MTDNLMFVISDKKIHANRINKTLTIGLPEIWIAHHNLKDGDSVSLKVDKDKNLVVTPNSNVK